MTGFSTAAQRSAFDDWVDGLREWQRDVGVDAASIAQYPLETKFGGAVEPEIAFGRFAGQRRWESVAEIPSSEIKDELLRLLVYQGDAEIRAVEQARQILDTAPTEHDRSRLIRHMAEETRHGWQMAYLLVTHFGDEGRREARALLERRATRGESLIGMFNLRLNWVEVFSWHNWGDRMGKYQLRMLAGSAFAPLARSIGPMLIEEGFHLVIGYQGMQRVVAAGRVPIEVQQRCINRMLSACYDGFGAEVSSHGARTYEWGLKAPYIDSPNIDPTRVNELPRAAFIEEVSKIMRLMNRLLPANGPQLYVTDARFNRHNGPYKGQPWNGPESLPSDEDETLLQELFKDPTWIAPPQ